MAGSFVPGLRDACAQTPGDAPSGESAAPSAPARAALSPGAAWLTRDADASPVWIRHRFDAFEDDFSDDFGVSRPLSEGEAVEHLQSELGSRWGDTRWYDWLRRGLAVYARLQALTEAERRGFDMEVETDDLAEGKFGVRVSRALE